MFHNLLYSIENDIARITMNRPEKRNALNGEVIAELSRRSRRRPRVA